MDTFTLHVEAHRAVGTLVAADADALGRFQWVEDCFDASPNPSVDRSVDQPVVVQDSSTGGGPPAPGQHLVEMQAATWDTCEHHREAGDVIIRAYVEVRS